MGRSDVAETPASPPRQRGVSARNIGLVLAVAAGVAMLLEAVWPGSAPQSESLNFWLPLAVVSGCAFLLAAYLADRHQLIARVLLIVFGLALLGSGIYFGVLSGGGVRSVWALAADIGPAILALIAVPIVGPVQRRALP